MNKLHYIKLLIFLCAFTHKPYFIFFAWCNKEILWVWFQKKNNMKEEESRKKFLQVYYQCFATHVENDLTCRGGYVHKCVGRRERKGNWIRNNDT